MSRTALTAIGGNSLITDKNDPDIPHQWDAVRKTCHHLAEEHFAPASMQPKIEAVLDFLAHGGKQAHITSSDKLGQAMQHETGTWITK